METHPPTRRRPRAWVLLPVAIVAVAAHRGDPACAQSAPAAPVEIKIGVISPKAGGRSSAAGRAHEDAIRLALEGRNSTLFVGGQAVRLTAIFENDQGQDTEAVAKAESLVQQGVVAILGPVNSASTRAVINKNLEVPILSSQSTAPDLTESGNRWFFRVTVDDRERMRRYAEFIANEKVMAGAYDFLLYEDDAYGRGLKDSLAAALDTTDEDRMEFPWPMFEDAAAGDRASMEQDAVDEIVRLLPDRPTRLFVLGTGERAVSLARLVSARTAGRRPAGSLGFFFVGDPQIILSQAPEGSFTIGEPVRERPSQSEPDLGESTVARRRRKNDSTYETAYYVLPQALSMALERSSKPDDVAALRLALRDTLEQGTFDSLTPWSKIRFSRGNLENPPATPVYRIGRTFERVDAVVPPRWVDVEVPRTVRWFESPAPIVFVGQGFLDGQKLGLKLVREPGREIIEEAELTFHAGKATYQYLGRQLGRMTVLTDVPSVPHRPTFDVTWTFNYVFAVLAGVLGSLYRMNNRVGQDKRTAAVPLAIGALSGVAMFAIATVGRLVPQIAALPIPTFDGPPWLSAICSGALGGWLGFHIPFMRQPAPGTSPEPAAAASGPTAA